MPSVPSKYCVTAAICALAVLSASAEAQRSEPPPPSAEKQAKIDLAIEHGTARGLYNYLKEQAGGGASPGWRNLPDWSGVWTREGVLFFFDQDQASFDNLPTAPLRPDARQRLIDKLDAIDAGIEFDPLSAGNPAGMPRWLTEPFLREFAVTPQETWLINEMMNEARRIYTDGRDHPPAEDAYPLWEGDSIGFWDGDRLIIHTNQLRSGQYQRIQPEYSDQVEVVEIWRKVAEDTMDVDVWIFDPPVLTEPWYAKQVYKKLTNEDGSLRIRYWDFSENQNNDVIVNDSGTSDFSDLTFTDSDDN